MATNLGACMRPLCAIYRRGTGLAQTLRLSVDGTPSSRCTNPCAHRSVATFAPREEDRTSRWHDGWRDRIDASRPNRSKRKVSGAQRYVHLSRLPSTCTINDVRRICKGADDGSRIPDITAIRMLYSRSFQPTGEAIVAFGTPREAVSFLRRPVGGVTAAAKLIDPDEAYDVIQRTFADRYDYASPSPTSHTDLVSSGALHDLVASYSGRTVLLRGLPSNITSQRLERMLAGYGLGTKGPWRRPKGLLMDLYRRDHSRDAEDSPKDEIFHLDSVIQLRKTNPRSITSPFLVRLQTATAAERLRSRWHMTYWDHARTLARAASSAGGTPGSDPGSLADPNAVWKSNEGGEGDAEAVIEPRLHVIYAQLLY